VLSHQEWTVVVCIYPLGFISDTDYFYSDYHW